jgi:protein involved in polysaccharide export with SLBB domain
MDALNATHKVGPGDRISFRVIEDEDPALPLLVADSGEMEVPHIGRVIATGKTCKALAYEIKRELEKDYYYQATVILGLDVIGNRVASRGKAYVMGQVRAQGGVDIPADEVFTVSKAILRAGGFSDYANERKVKLVRKVGSNGATESKIVDLVEIMKRGKTAGDVVVEPEDVIIVPEKLVVF